MRAFWKWEEAFLDMESMEQGVDQAQDGIGTTAHATS